MTTSTSSLIASVSIESLLAHREAIITRLHQIESLSNELNQIASAAEDEFKAAHGSDRYSAHSDGYEPLPRYPISYKHAGGHGSRATADAIQDTDRKLWRFLMARSGMLSFMDTQARAEWIRSTSEPSSSHERARLNMPEFTRENIESTFEAIYAKRGEYLCSGARNALSAISRKHKTNECGRWTKKIIVRGASTTWHKSVDPSPTDNFLNTMDDVQRILCVLRELPEPAPEQQAREVFHRQYKNGAGSWIIDMMFFTVKLHKSNTAHIEFKFDADVDRLNQAVSHATGGTAIASDEQSWRTNRSA